MAAVCVRICRFISVLNLLFILQFYTVWQPKGLCYPTMTKFNAKASFIKNASCRLDPVPTWLVKSCLDVLASSITEMVNLSLLSGCVPEN